MDNFTVHIKPQFVKQTKEVEIINGRECRLHEVQKRLKLGYKELPEFTIITAPTGTGKSYAFPFPVLNSIKDGNDIDAPDSIRGLIVLPTNALISELTENFKSTYPSLVINQLTGAELNKYEVKGFERWKKAIEIAENSDLVITNPDIINYAMHGGYHQWAGHKKTGDKIFSKFLVQFSYLIFDEYHLYDEAQIANILTLVKLRENLLQHYKVIRGREQGIRFLFVSATPEKGLSEIFENEEYEYEDIIEEIVDEPDHARAIHGKLEVEFINNKDIKELIRSKIPEIQSILPSKKILLILDRLRDVQELAKELEGVFPEYQIYQSTGYVSKSENAQEKIKSANIIIATNKAEVGVNYEVEYCIMDPGKYYQNFIQRFGRIARGDIDGKIIINSHRKFNRYKSSFKRYEFISYYDFLEKVRMHMQTRNFYSERVPMFLGEYIWCIQNRLQREQGYNSFMYLNRRLNETAFFQSKEATRFLLMKDIHSKICEMMQLALGRKISRANWNKEVDLLEIGSPRTYEWATWWKNYLNTYLTFRDGSKVVKIYDKIKQEELDYSLDWILQHKQVEEVKVLQTEPYEVVKYIVGDLKKRDNDIQYTVSTIPNAGIPGNSLLAYKDMYDLDRVFKNSVSRIYDKVKIGPDEIHFLQVELCQKVKLLASTFSRKRLEILGIENDEMFI
ncbi:MAG: type I-D CRISPR-associated helicase Cas3' [Bacteroidota bacterium]